MKKVLKLAVVLALALLAVFSFAACADDGSNPTPSATVTPQPSTEPTPEPDPNGTLKYQFSGSYFTQAMGGTLSGLNLKLYESEGDDIFVFQYGWFSRMASTVDEYQGTYRIIRGEEGEADTIEFKYQLGENEYTQVGTFSPMEITVKLHLGGTLVTSDLNLYVTWDGPEGEDKLAEKITSELVAAYSGSVSYSGQMGQTTYGLNIELYEGNKFVFNYCMISPMASMVGNYSGTYAITSGDEDDTITFTYTLGDTEYTVEGVYSYTTMKGFAFHIGGIVPNSQDFLNNYPDKFVLYRTAPAQDAE